MYFDEDTVQLKSAIDLDDLCKGEGSMFEIDPNSFEGESLDYDVEKMLNQMNTVSMTGKDGFDDENAEKDNDDLEPFERLACKMEDITPDKDGGVLKQVLQGGSGNLMPRAAQVTTHYQAFLEYADEPFDSTRLRGRPNKMKLGDGTTIPGLELGLSTMKKGELSRFLIKPMYAFGKGGCPPRIPPEATVIFEVEVIGILDTTPIDEYYSNTFEWRKNATIDQLLSYVKAERKVAKTYFQEKRFHKALLSYNRAVRIIEDCRLRDEGDEKTQKASLIQIYTNLAVCALKLHQMQRCISFCNECLNLDRQHCKVLYLKGKAKHKLGDFHAAKACLLKAQSFKPDDRDIVAELRQLELDVKKYRLDEVNLCKRMLKLEDHEDGSKENTDVSPEFKSSIELLLQPFLDDSNIMELPLPAMQLTAGEVACVRSVATGLGLDVVKRGEGNNMHYRVLKTRLAAPSKSPNQEEARLAGPRKSANQEKDSEGVVLYNRT